MSIITLEILLTLVLVSMAAWIIHRASLRQRMRALDAANREQVTAVERDYEARIQRLTREYDTSMKFAHHPLARDVLPAVDSLRQAAIHAEAAGEGAEMVEGLRLVIRELEDVLGRHGITRIEPARGDDFDPTLHEAVQVVDAQNVASRAVVECLRPGYRDGERVLRPAMVSVARAAATDDEAHATSSPQPRATSGGQDSPAIGDGSDNKEAGEAADVSPEDDAEPAQDAQAGVDDAPSAG